MGCVLNWRKKWKVWFLRGNPVHLHGHSKQQLIYSSQRPWKLTTCQARTHRIREKKGRTERTKKKHDTLLALTFNGVTDCVPCSLVMFCLRVAWPRGWEHVLPDLAFTCHFCPFWELKTKTKNKKRIYCCKHLVMLQFCNKLVTEN